MSGTVDPAAKENRNEAALQLFKRIGLDERTAQNAVANAKVTSNLVDSINEVMCVDNRSVGAVRNFSLYSVSL